MVHNASLLPVTASIAHLDLGKRSTSEQLQLEVSEPDDGGTFFLFLARIDPHAAES